HIFQIQKREQDFFCILCLQSNTNTDFPHSLLFKMKKEDIMRGLANIRHGKSTSTDQTVTSSSLTTSTTTTTTITHHGSGSKVLPISETNSVCSSARSQKETDQEDHGGETTRKAKALSRMRELLRWAAASKAQKGGKYLGRKVLCFRSKGVIKGLPNVGGDLSSDSPKISFRWEVESFSTTTSSAMSASSAPPLMSVGRSDRCGARALKDWKDELTK
ncbi:hypothetical protein V2J09_005116, partial [Rumex salicifolius]